MWSTRRRSLTTRRRVVASATRTPILSIAVTALVVAIALSVAVGAPLSAVVAGFGRLWGLRNVGLDLLTVYLTTVHVFASTLRIVHLFVLNICKSLVEGRVYAVTGHFYMLYGSIGAKYLNNMFFGYVAT